jgi:hypothetical protein
MADEHDPQCRARLAVVVEAARALLRELDREEATPEALDRYHAAIRRLRAVLEGGADGD